MMFPLVRDLAADKIPVAPSTAPGQGTNGQPDAQGAVSALFDQKYPVRHIR